MGNAINDSTADLAGLYEVSTTQDLQVLGGVCEGETGFPGEFLDGSGTLAEQFEQREAFRATERLTDACDFGIHGIFQRILLLTHVQILQ